jgi:hypothetical protein
MNISPDLDFELADLMGQSMGFFGKTRSGKSNGMRVWLEEIVLTGQPIAMTIIDPENEYWSLKQVGAFLVIGEDEHCDLPCDITHAATLAQFSVEHGISVILSLSHFDEHEAGEFIAAYLTGLWDAQKRKRRPYLLVVDEVQEFANQERQGPATSILIRLFKRGLKKGFIIILASQRPSDVEKSIVTQLRTYFLHLVTYPNDLAIYKKVLPLKPGETDKMIKGLAIGQAVVVRDGDFLGVAQIRKAITFDAGATPGLEAVEEEPALRDNSDVVAELKRLLSADSPPEDRETAKLRHQIGELQDALSEKTAALEASTLTIDQQRSEIEALVNEIATLRAQLAAIRSNGHATSGNIEHMHVDAIHADQIVTGGGTLTPMQAADQYREAVREEKGGDETTTKPAQDRAQSLLDLAARREQQNSERAINRERRGFNSMLTRIQQRVRPAWLSVYGYLMLYEGKRFSVDDLCRILSYQYATLKDLPNELLDQGLLHRAGRGQESVYWSTTREALGRLYPALDVEDMFHLLLDAVSPKGK